MEHADGDNIGMMGVEDGFHIWPRRMYRAVDREPSDQDATVNDALDPRAPPDDVTLEVDCMKALRRDFVKAAAKRIYQEEIRVRHAKGLCTCTGVGAWVVRHVLSLHDDRGRLDVAS